MPLRPRMRALLMTALAAAALLAPGAPAVAGHCPSQPTEPDDWCHQTAPPPRTPTPRPATPAPTPVPPPPPPDPTPAPTARPTRAPTRTTPRPARTTPRPVTTTTVTPGPLDELEPDLTTPDPLLDEFPESTPRIVARPIPVETEEPSDEIRLAQSGGDSSPAWWASLFVGLVIGFLAGRMSWGLKRKKKQQIFG